MRTLEDRRAHLRDRVEYWSERLKAAPRVIRIVRMTRKWGSCSTGGVVTFAEDLAGEEQEFQDYVIVHELLHLRVPNHGKVFKALMTAYLPRWRDHERYRHARRYRGLPR